MKPLSPIRHYGVTSHPEAAVIRDATESSVLTGIFSDAVKVILAVSGSGIGLLLRCAKLCDLVRPSTSSTPIPIGIAHHRKREAQGIIVGPSIAPQMAPALPPQGLCLSLFVEPASEFDLSFTVTPPKDDQEWSAPCTTVPMLSKKHILYIK